MKKKSIFGVRKASPIYDYASAEAREETAAFLLDRSARAKENTAAYWRKMRRYYDGKHSSFCDSAAFSAGNGLAFETAVCSDGYIQVESQIDPKLPDFEFAPKGDEDAAKAKQREKIVRHIREKSDTEELNALNERRLGIYGSAVWKVCWDADYSENGIEGEVMLHAPKPEEVYPDPTAASIDDCEYIGYVYRMHRMKARRIFAADAERLGLDIDEILSAADRNGSMGLFDDLSERSIYDEDGDTVRITEWWFRQPSDGKASVSFTDSDGDDTVLDYEWSSGDVALSVLVGEKELRYIPKYWKNTDCKLMPFAIYSRIADDNSVWGKSELEAIIPMIDAADRDLTFAQLNAAFTSNDIIVAEENALSDGCTLDNTPGAVWTLRPGMMGKVQRLGNMAYSENGLYSSFAMWRELMQNTTGNYDSYQGSEPSRVTTATGIALLNERAKTRSSLKKIGKISGFKRLYTLIDRTALEYYDDGRVIAIGAEDGENSVFRFGDCKEKKKGNVYIPDLDVKIHIGDGLDNSKALTVSSVNDLIKTPITKENYRLVCAFVELIGLPMREDICESIREQFEQTENTSETGSAHEENDIPDNT